MTHVAIGSKDYIQQRALIPTPEELAKLADVLRDGETLVGMIRREVLDRFRSNRPCLWREANP